jgi:hypothetical protein
MAIVVSDKLLYLCEEREQFFPMSAARQLSGAVPSHRELL